jgi:hypothetical protein
MRSQYKVSKNSIALLASVEVKTNGESAKTAPISLVARTTTPVSSGDEKIGMCVHDFAGMRVERNRIPVDYCHESSKVIGYANHIEAVGGELMASGALVPYGNDPTDKATEVIYKAQQGIPYQASIYTGSDVVVEKLANGKTTVVNGVSVMGPLSIVREWTLRGIAICPYGRDGNTISAIALNDQETVTVTETETTESTTEATEVQAVEVAEANDTQSTEAAAVEVETVAEVAASPEAVSVEATAMSEGQKFLATFGTQGAVWFAEGKSFDEAQALFALAMKTENESLKQQLADAMSKLAANRGEATPVTFSAKPIEPEAKATDAKKFSGRLPDGLARFAAGIQKLN